MFTEIKRLDRASGLLVLVLVLLLATGLRFHKLGVQSFWNDEGNSARLSERSPALIIEGTASDIHPPLYYLMLRGWRELAGDSEFGLRSFSAAAGILTVAAAIAAARILFAPSANRKAAAITVYLSGLLAAVNPALVYYSQETRMYALLALIGVLSTLALLRWITAAKRTPWAVAYVALSVAGLYTHYFYPALFALQGAVLLVSLTERRSSGSAAALPPGRGRTLFSWLMMIFISVLLYLPWMPVFLRQAGGRAAERAALPDFIWGSLRWMLFGETIAGNELIWLTAAAILLLLWAIIGYGRRIAVPVVAVTFVLAAMYAAGSTSPVFFKFMLVAVPFVAIWLAAAAWRAPPLSSGAGRIVQVAAVAAAVVVFAGMLFSLANLYDNPDFARADYRGMAARIAADAQPNAAVILNAPNQWEVFTYYHRDGAPVYPLPKGQPDPAILDLQLAEIIAQHDRLYVLFWGEELRDPDGVIETWLDTHAFKASENWVGDVRFAIYAAPEKTATGPEMPLNVDFGQQITQLGYTLIEDSYRPGDIVQVALYWTAMRPLEERYKVFVHLLSEDGALVAQSDSEPSGGALPTTVWQPDEIVADFHGLLLPADLPAGEYEIQAGLYHLNNPQDRLHIESLETGPTVVSLGKIIVE